MKCSYCGEVYIPSVGCCALAAMNLALIALNYHCECEHGEVSDAKTQLRNALEKGGAL